MRLARRKSDKLPCAIGEKIIHFLSRCLFPARMKESLTSAFRGKDRKKRWKQRQIRVKRVTFQMEIGRSSNGYGTRVGDDGGIEDESVRDPVGERGRRV